MTTNHTDETSPKKKGLSRRTVVTGTAWAVPAIVVAGPAPHAAATPIPPVTIGGTACKIPGNSGNVRNGVAFELTITNPYNTPLVVNITSVTKSGDVAPTQIVPASFTIPAKSTKTVVLEAGPYNNSSNASITVGYSYLDPTTNTTRTGTAGPTTVNIVPVQGAQCPFVIPG